MIPKIDGFLVRIKISLLNAAKRNLEIFYALTFMVIGNNISHENKAKNVDGSEARNLETCAPKREFYRV